MLKCLKVKMLKCEGFTLIEIVVVVSIMIILSTIVLVNYKSFGDQFALQRSANQLAQNIRRAQEMAMSAKECPAGITNCPAAGQPFSYIYGIYTKKSPPGQPVSKSYILFADIDDDGEFKTANDAVIEEIQLEKGIIVTGPGGGIRKTHVTFASPDPAIKIKINDDFKDEASIELSIETDLSRTKTITVNKAGLIEIK